MATDKLIDKQNAVWFAKHSQKYTFKAQTTLKVEPESIDRSVYGHFIRAPFPHEGVARWGFLSAEARDAFCKAFKGKAL